MSWYDQAEQAAETYKTVPFEVPSGADTVHEGPCTFAAGTRWLVSFPNGFAGSVIDYGYGSDQGLFEVAVMYRGHLCYSTPITSDVLGHLSPSSVTAVLEQIAALPRRPR
jgi:hypothetical protein